MSITLTAPPRHPAHKVLTRPPRLRHVRLGIPDENAELDEDDEFYGRPIGAPAPAAALPDPTALCCCVVRAALDVLRGERPATQLARWVTPQVLDQLSERVRLIRLATPGPWPAQILGPAMVRRVRMDRSGDTAEATVILDDHGRVRAAAVRLEVRRDQWRIAVLELA